MLALAFCNSEHITFFTLLEKKKQQPQSKNEDDCLQSMCLLLYSSFSWHHYDNHLFAAGKGST